MLPIEQTDFQQLHKKTKNIFTLFSHELQLISIQSEDRNVTRICRTIDITVMLFLNNFSQVENATLTCQMFNVQTFVHTIIQYQIYNQTYNTNICKDGDYVLYKRFIYLQITIYWYMKSMIYGTVSQGLNVVSFYIALLSMCLGMEY